MGRIEVLRDESKADFMRDSEYKVLVFEPPNNDFSNSDVKLVSIEGDLNYCLAQTDRQIENEIYGDNFTMVVQMAEDIEFYISLGDLEYIDYMCYKLAEFCVNHSIKIRIVCYEDDIRYIAYKFKQRIIYATKDNNGLLS